MSRTDIVTGSGSGAGTPAPGTSRRRGSRRQARADALTGLGFAAPVLIGVTGLGLVPFGFVIWYSLHDWNPLLARFRWVGLENFRTLVDDDVVWSALRTTLVFTVLLMAINITLAMALAVLINQRLRGITTFRAFFFSPVVVSSVAWVLLWQYLVADNGGLNGFLAMIGVDGPNWLRDEAWALPTVVIIQVFKGVGMNMILFLAALQGVPAELKESARIDGAGAWKSFWRISMPMIAPTVLLVSIITMVGAMNVFVPIQLLTSGGPGRSTTVMSYLLYQTAFRENDFGYASAIGVLLFVIILALTVLQWGTRKKWVHDET